MSPKEDTQKSVKSTTATNKKVTGFTDEERAAMKEYLQERKTPTARGPRADKADGGSAVLAQLAEMREPERAVAKRPHAIIRGSPAGLPPRTGYGMPGCAK